MTNEEEILCRLAEYKKREARAEYILSNAQWRYWRYILKNFPQFRDSKYHLECHAGENFIVDGETGSEIYYLPNGFKL